MTNKIILPYDVIGYINSFLPRPVHPIAKILKKNIGNYSKFMEYGGRAPFFNYYVINNYRKKWNRKKNCFFSAYLNGFYEGDYYKYSGKVYFQKYIYI